MITLTNLRCELRFCSHIIYFPTISKIREDNSSKPLILAVKGVIQSHAHNSHKVITGLGITWIPIRIPSSQSGEKKVSLCLLQKHFVGVQYGMHKVLLLVAFEPQCIVNSKAEESNLRPNFLATTDQH